jgi:predicted site-specific integrase-resolvase
MKDRKAIAEKSENRPAVDRLAYSMAETAEALGISYISVHRLVKRGLLRSSSALRTKVIPRTEIERFLAQ